MLTKRTIIGLVVGSIIIALGSYSLVSHIGPTVAVNEYFTVDVGNPISLTISAPANAPQSIEIMGDTFDLKLESPGDGLQIPNTSYKKELILDWVHSADGQSKIKIQNTGNKELDITVKTEQTPDPIGITFDLMLMVSGLVILGLSMGLTVRKPKGF